jgi:hypothetical protein
VTLAGGWEGFEVPVTEVSRLHHFLAAVFKLGFVYPVRYCSGGQFQSRITGPGEDRTCNAQGYSIRIAELSGPKLEAVEPG